MLRAEIRQRPVGQGGLLHGEINAGGGPLHWIYDCGSNQSDALAREVGKLPREIDLLFISHLDSDHVSGIDLLLGRCEAREVVLPYLEDHERLLALGRAASDGRLTGQYLDFMAGPADWLLRRGVAQVTFVRGGEDGEGPPDGPDPAPEPSPDAQGRLKPVWSREPQQAPGGRPRVRIAEPGALLRAWTGGGPADWVLLPQAYPPSKARVKAFRAELAKRFPKKSAAQIVQAIWTAAGRDELRACYEKLWVDPNLVSMSLYMGPAPHGAGAWTREARWDGGGWWSHRGPPGWLATGDADLSGPRRRRAFQRFYQAYLGQVAVLVAPHHGSAASWHPDVLQGLSGLRIGCAAAGPNGYDHPNSIVIDDIEGHPADFVQVSERASSLLALRGWR